jgi:hypothetical protein
MVEVFARRLNIVTRAIGMTDVLSPSQVRTFSDCEVRWFYEHLLGLRDPLQWPMLTSHAENAGDPPRRAEYEEIRIDSMFVERMVFGRYWSRG